MTDIRIKLNNGTEIPALGLGTWKSEAGEVQKAIVYALQNGYKHVDGGIDPNPPPPLQHCTHYLRTVAYCYANEDEVGEGLTQAFESGVKREDIFVTAKLWSTYHSRVEQNLDLSLKSLGLSYVDLYLVHWPVAMNPNGTSKLCVVWCPESHSNGY